jgi:hypothetical protein
MKTRELITLLATGVDQERVASQIPRFAYAIGLGTLLSVALMMKAIPVNPHLGDVIQLQAFWEKFGFALAIAIISMVMVLRLARPGIGLGGASFLLALPILVMWGVALTSLATAEADDRAALFFGSTWKVCPFLIAMLASPVFVASFWFLRDLAPTRLRATGAAAGMFSGGVGAVVYCFHCPELDAPFIAFWYLLGILIPAITGALIGPRMLRW